MLIQISQRVFRAASLKFRLHAQSLLRLIDLLDYYIHEVRSHNAYVLNFHIQLIPFMQLLFAFADFEELAVIFLSAVQRNLLCRQCALPHLNAGILSWA